MHCSSKIPLFLFVIYLTYLNLLLNNFNKACSESHCLVCLNDICSKCDWTNNKYYLIALTHTCTQTCGLTSGYFANYTDQIMYCSSKYFCLN